MEFPEIGEVVICTVEFWRYGNLHRTEEIKAEYLGMNDVIGKPMFDIDTYDEAYANVVKWSRLANKACTGRVGTVAKNSKRSKPTRQ